MKYKAILFDMDGTLLPMDMDVFVEGYFKELNKKLAHYGIPVETLTKAIWAGTSQMTKNDGSMKNEMVFWNYFEKLTGITDEGLKKDCEDFYGNEFHRAKKYTGENPLARKAVEIAHEKADIVALATNPLFPMRGQVTRMGWVGLSPEDFDLVSCYEEDSWCKPNPDYFRSVCQKLGVSPEECLMIGNDEMEDMYAGTQAGLTCYLVTDNKISCKEHPWNGPQGTFDEMVEMLQNL